MSAIPSDSNWKTHLESPLQSMSNVGLSCSSIVLMSKSGMVLRMSSTVCLISVSVLRPRKSIFTSPQFSICVIGYCVEMDPVFGSA